MNAPSYLDEDKEDKKEEDKPEEAGEENDDDEFERDDDDNEANAADDEDDNREDVTIERGSNQSVKLKININVSNQKKVIEEVKEEKKEYCMDNELLDLLFTFIGASSKPVEDVKDIQREKLALFNTSLLTSRSTAGTTEIMPGPID